MRRGATSRPPPKPPHLPRGLSRASDNKSTLVPASVPLDLGYTSDDDVNFDENVNFVEDVNFHEDDDTAS